LRPAAEAGGCTDLQPQVKKACMLLKIAACAHEKWTDEHSGATTS
jgi:hypothetical protein